MSEPVESPPPAPQVPRARVERERERSLSWVLPLAAALFAAFLAWQSWSERGTRIEVLAGEGHGIEAGDPLRYRGITVGEIEEVRLDDDLSRVRLAVRLSPSASDLARRGSRFWVVRPHLSLDGVQGLETVVGARYLSVLPGPPGEPREATFVALDEPPVAETIEPGGLRFVIESPSRFGLAPGAAIHYRGVRVGTLLAVDLASDATSVELSAYVRPAFAPLVRTTTRFWETGGLEVDLGWVRGLKIEVDSLRSLLVGGLTMATPPEPAPAVAPGHHFQLALDPEEAWLEWRPALAVDEEGLGVQAGLPRLVRAQLDWEQGRLWSRSRSRVGWLLPIPGGLLGPADVLGPVEDARGEGATLSVEGERLPLLVEPTTRADGLALLALDLPGRAPWPASRLALGAEVADCLVVADPTVPPAALSGARLVPEGGGWRLEGGPRFDPSWHGAAVVRRGDGRLVGILLVGEDERRIARPQEAWW